MFKLFSNVEDNSEEKDNSITNFLNDPVSIEEVTLNTKHQKDIDNFEWEINENE